MTAVKILRKRHLWTQAALSEISGVPRVNIVRYEKGQREPKVSDAIKLARALGVTVEELMGDELPETPERNMMVSAETR